METSEQVIENTTEIANLKQGYEKIEKAIDDIRKTLLNRPTQTMLKAIAILCGLLGTAIGTSITLLVMLVKTVP